MIITSVAYSAWGLCRVLFIRISINKYESAVNRFHARIFFWDRDTKGDGKSELEHIAKE